MSSSAAAPLPGPEQEQRRLLRSGAPVRFLAPGAVEETEQRRARTIEAAWLAELTLGGTATQPIEIEHAVIRGAWRSQYVHFEREVRFLGCEFSDPVDLSGCEFDRTADFAGCHFAAACTCHGVRVKDNADFRGARFDGTAGFVNLSVGQQANFTEALFRGAVHFNDASLHVASFSAARFCQSATFDRATFTGIAFFAPDPTPGVCNDPAVFTGNASFTGCHFEAQAVFWGVQFAGEAVFDASTFDSTVHFERNGEHPARFGGLTSFASIVAKLDLFFYDAIFEDDITFQSARLRGLLFRDTICERPSQGLQFHGELDLSGCAMDSIGIAWAELIARPGAKNDWMKLRLMPGSLRALALVERTLREEGRSSEADDVYLRRRQIETSQIGGLSAWVPRFYGWAAGYGVRPHRLLWGVGAFLALGTLVFSLPGAALWKDAAQHAAAPLRLDPWQALAFSVNQFLPGDLPLGGAWKVADGWFAAYATLHRAASVVLLTWLIATVRDLLGMRHLA